MSIKDIPTRPEVSFWIAVFLPIIGFAISWGAATARAEGQQKAIEEIKTEVAKYPSEDWFILRFQGIDNRFTELEKKIDKHIDLK